MLLGIKLRVAKSKASREGMGLVAQHALDLVLTYQESKVKKKIEKFESNKEKIWLRQGICYSIWIFFYFFCHLIIAG